MDVQRIREVLMHLLENAGKYSDPGVPIKVTSEVKGEYLVTSVADRGPGIDSFEQSLIFEKFYRGQHQRYSAPGTGMGLAIAKVIVEAHGGTHWRRQPIGQRLGLLVHPAVREEIVIALRGRTRNVHNCIRIEVRSASNTTHWEGADFSRAVNATWISASAAEGTILKETSYGFLM